MKKTVLFIFCLVFISCFKEPKKDGSSSTDYTETVVNNNTTLIEKPIKKYVYVELKVSIPILNGIKSDSFGNESSCYVDYKNEDYNSEIVELDSYDENVKYKLLDDMEKKFLSEHKFYSFWETAVEEYGYEAAEHLKNQTYSVKILENNVYVFDSYAEASKSLRGL